MRSLWLPWPRPLLPTLADAKALNHSIADPFDVGVSEKGVPYFGVLIKGSYYLGYYRGSSYILLVHTAQVAAVC